MCNTSRSPYQPPALGSRCCPPGIAAGSPGAAGAAAAGAAAAGAATAGADPPETSPAGPVLGATEQDPDDKVELPEGPGQLGLRVGHEGHLRPVHEQNEPGDEGAQLRAGNPGVGADEGPEHHG